ncbi:olfactory receptor 10C1-like [Rhinoderma darwinii]|uniref:olfactory receptor 10C1-like n=1 Tax=Rhinoderma darwinii TaxID=43563 RepID=UPI003F66F5B8
MGVLISRWYLELDLLSIINQDGIQEVLNVGTNQKEYIWAIHPPNNMILLLSSRRKERRDLRNFYQGQAPLQLQVVWTKVRTKATAPGAEEEPGSETDYVVSLAGGRLRMNQTTVTNFIILGFSAFTDVCLPIFFFLLFVYLATLIGNGAVVYIVHSDLALHSPMYFFLCNLSILEIVYSSVTMPKILINLLSKDKKISFIGCAIQMFFFLSLGTTECLLLAVMAFDRFNAICRPLHYSLVMSAKNCCHLSAFSWLSGALLSMGQTTFIFSLPYCGPNVIDHFFCDIPPVLKLACSETYLNEIAIFSVCVAILLTPFLLILGSYTQIISTLLKMTSVENRGKAYSTCISHLTSVTLFYGTASFMYLRPRSLYSLETDRFLSLFYSVVTPMLNPLIYSLRNQEVKASFLRILKRPHIFSTK